MDIIKFIKFNPDLIHMTYKFFGLIDAFNLYEIINVMNDKDIVRQFIELLKYSQLHIHDLLAHTERYTYSQNIFNWIFNFNVSVDAICWGYTREIFNSELSVRTKQNVKYLHLHGDTAKYLVTLFSNCGNIKSFIFECSHKVNILSLESFIQENKNITYLKIFTYLLTNTVLKNLPSIKYLSVDLRLTPFNFYNLIANVKYLSTLQNLSINYCDYDDCRINPLNCNSTSNILVHLTNVELSLLGLYYISFYAPNIQSIKLFFYRNPTVELVNIWKINQNCPNIEHIIFQSDVYNELLYLSNLRLLSFEKDIALVSDVGIPMLDLIFQNCRLLQSLRFTSQNYLTIDFINLFTKINENCLYFREIYLFKMNVISGEAINIILDNKNLHKIGFKYQNLINCNLEKLCIMKHLTDLMIANCELDMILDNIFIKLIENNLNLESFVYYHDRNGIINIEKFLQTIQLHSRNMKSLTISMSIISFQREDNINWNYIEHDFFDRLKILFQSCPIKEFYMIVIDGDYEQKIVTRVKQLIIETRFKYKIFFKVTNECWKNGSSTSVEYLPCCMFHNF